MLRDAVRCYFPNTQTRPVVILEYRVRDRHDRFKEVSLQE